jgi:hypothetical protein
MRRFKGKIGHTLPTLPLFLSRIRYYGSSLVTLLAQFERPFELVRLFAVWPRHFPTRVRLRRTGRQFNVRDALDVWVIKEIWLDGEYGDPAQPGWSVVDIGAGIGEFAVLSNCQGATVHAYEPDAAAFRLLEKNVSLNGHSGIRAWHEPVSAESPPTLMTVLDRLPSGYCDWLKLDCEGCEFDLILRSDPAVWHRIERISLEYHDNATRSHQALIGRLQQAGYHVTRRRNPAHTHLGILHAKRPVTIDRQGKNGCCAGPA